MRWAEIDNTSIYTAICKKLWSGGWIFLMLIFVASYFHPLLSFSDCYVVCVFSPYIPFPYEQQYLLWIYRLRWTLDRVLASSRPRAAEPFLIGPVQLDKTKLADVNKNHTIC